MRLSTRSLLALLPAVTLVMVLYMAWGIVQRTTITAEAARRETRAYSNAVGVAFDHAFRDLQFGDIQEILNRVGSQPEIFALVVYDTAATPIMFSEGVGARDAAPPRTVRGVLASGQPSELERDLGAQGVFWSVLRPIRGAGETITGVLEVLQPLEIDEERARITRRFALNTLTLLLVVGGLTLWLHRALLDRPLRRFLAAIRTLGTGDLTSRVGDVGSAGELVEVGREFDRMADALETARESLVREGEERLALENRVREQEKLASLGTLAGGVAHQISAPLNVIDGRARLLLGHAGDDPELQRNLRVIVDQSDRIVRVVRALLDFAKRPDPRTEPVDLSDVARAAVRGLRLDGRPDATRVTIEADEGAIVRGDPDLLREVVTILLTNAVEAVGEVGGGEVGIRVTQEDGDACVSITDTGGGIPPDVLPRIFEEFFTTKPGGTGLGLAIARNIVERLGGRMEVGSSRGTTVGFRIPLAAGKGTPDA